MTRRGHRVLTETSGKTTRGPQNLLPRLLKLPVITASESDVTGRIVVMNIAKTLPFEVRRSYWIYGMRLGERRGMHAHRNLIQGMVAVSGQIAFELHDGHSEQHVVLERPDQILILPPGFWRNFVALSEGAVLMVFASADFDEADYIRSFDEFLVWKAHA